MMALALEFICVRACVFSPAFHPFYLMEYGIVQNSVNRQVPHHTVLDVIAQV